jgi:ribosomal protein L7Ae-like RNA K-turn-binding protein
MKTLKEACKKHNIKFHKSATKDELCNSLGKCLYESKTVLVIDEEKDITFSNLTKSITE